MIQTVRQHSWIPTEWKFSLESFFVWHWIYRRVFHWSENPPWPKLQREKELQRKGRKSVGWDTNDFPPLLVWLLLLLVRKATHLSTRGNCIKTRSVEKIAKPNCFEERMMTMIMIAMLCGIRGTLANDDKGICSYS